MIYTSKARGCVNREDTELSDIHVTNLYLGSHVTIDT